MGFRKALQLIISISLVVQSVEVFSQTDSAHWNYINQWSTAAVEEMLYSKIPASITMAQALHESRYGTSELAVKANNHFGIKCQTEWTGRSYTYQDDDDNTCFRLYESVPESFRDHSDFLMTRPRYAFLFDLDPADYAGWAHGLKKAGYATNPNYAFILIRLIEDYNLFTIDEQQPELEPMNSKNQRRIPNYFHKPVASKPKVFSRNRIEFMLVRPGDNIKNLTRSLNMLNWEIRKYNEISRNEDVYPGQVIYLQPKRRKAEAGYTFHTAEPGESMYSISQLYGIRLKWIYRRNRMIPGTQPRPGQEIWLRGMKPALEREEREER